MLSYETFEKKLVEELRKCLPEYSIIVETVLRVNHPKKAISILKEGADAAPTYYIEDEYQKFSNCGDLSDVVANIVKTVKTLKAPSYTLSEMLNLDKVFFVLVNAGWNEELLKTVPHRKFLDLAIIYKILVNHDERGLQTVTVKKNHFPDVTEEELFQAALANTVKMFPIKIADMMTVVSEMMGIDVPKSEEIEVKENTMLVLTNTCGINGAAVMLYPDTLKKVADLFETDVIYIPSSIHEIIAISAKNNKPDVIKGMIMDVNVSQVELEERLSNCPYIYYRESGSIEMYVDKEKVVAQA